MATSISGTPADHRNMHQVAHAESERDAQHGGVETRSSCATPPPPIELSVFSPRPCRPANATPEVETPSSRQFETTLQSRPVGPAVFENAATLSKALHDIKELTARLARRLPPDIAPRLDEHHDWIREVERFVDESPQFLDTLRQAAISARAAEVDASTGQHGSPFARIGNVAQKVFPKLKRAALSPMAQAMLYVLISTQLKSDAWYTPTAIPDEKLVSPQKYVDDPAAWNAAVTAVDTEIGWDLALPEYIPLTLANQVADRNGINLANLRGVIEVMDLGWTVVFLKEVKHQSLGWPQYAGLAIVALGCAIVNKPKSVLPAMDESMTRLQAKIGAVLRLRRADQDTERNSVTLSQSQIHSDKADVEALLRRVGEPLIGQLMDLQADLRALLPSHVAAQLAEHADQAVPDFAANDPDELHRMLELKLTQVAELAAGAPQLASTLASVRDDLTALSKSTPDVLRRVFMGVWVVGQTAFIATAIAMMVKDHPMSETDAMIAVGALSGAATGNKLPAWYAHLIVPKEKLLPEFLTPANPGRRELAYKAAQIGMSWGLALPEYIFLNMLNRIADQHGISLAKGRAVIEGLDLLWFVALMTMVKHQKLEWQHILGLVTVGMGVAVANAF